MVKLIAQKEIQTRYGEFNFLVYQDEQDHEHVVLVKGEVKDKQDVFCRVHSACLLGELFHSSTCNCRQELDQAMELCQSQGQGIIIWLNHMSLSQMVKDFELMTQKTTLRNFIQAAEILKQLEVKTIKLMTKNQDKIEQLKEKGIEVSKY